MGGQTRNGRRWSNGTPVKEIVGHTGYHLEEHLAVKLARRYGREQWLGIQRAKLVERDGSDAHIQVHSPEWHLANKGQLWIGTGGGDFDEHGKEGNGPLCSASLVARFLGVDRKPRIQEMLAFATHEDREGGSTPFDLTQCVKRFSFVGWTPMRVQEWFNVFADLYLNTNHVYPVQDPEHYNLLELLQQWLEEKYILLPGEEFEWAMENDLVQHLVSRIVNLTKQAGQKLPDPNNPATWRFNLSEAVALINSVYHNPDVAYTWVKMLFEADVVHQREYLLAIPIVRKEAPEFIMVGETRIRLLVVANTKNRCILEAAKPLNPRPDIIIIRKKTGNTVITLNNKKLACFYPILMALRLEEQIRDGILDGDLFTGYFKLREPGRQDGSEAWYSYTDDNGGGRSIFNGSLTYPNVIPTKITLGDIKRIVKIALLMADDESTWKEYVANRLTRRQQEAINAASPDGNDNGNDAPDHQIIPVATPSAVNGTVVAEPPTQAAGSKPDQRYGRRGAKRRWIPQPKPANINQ